MATFHEPPEELDSRTRDYIRALATLREEIEAIDWYQQRIAASGDEPLKAILAHNQDEEMEHAAMSLEWLRRNMPGWDTFLRKYLFIEGDIVKVEEAETGESAPESGEPAAPTAPARDLGIGSLKR